MKSKEWLTGYFCIVLILLCAIGAVIYYIDPYFHYHHPYTEKFYYELSNQRYQNDGIVKHFDYDAMITGTSMTEQFKTSELDALFGTKSIKVPYSGATYKEINDHLKTALRYHPELKMVFRGLDMDSFLTDSDEMRYDAKEYPSYLYNENPFDDVKYLFNRDIMLNACYKLFAHVQGSNPGLTSFDEYNAWQNGYEWGIHVVCPDGMSLNGPDKIEKHLSSEEKLVIQENIQDNVTSLVKEYPDITFYYFFTPYSALWWAEQSVNRRIEIEQYTIELLLECDNIRLYSFNNRTDITTDLNHYHDKKHYATWINSLMLKWMHDGEYLLTKENYMDYLEEERAFYTEFDYASLNGQEDYECDDYAGALLRQELCGVEPLNLAMLSTEISDEEALTDGQRLLVQEIDAYKYLTFYGRGGEAGQVLAQILDEEGETVAEIAAEDVSDEEQDWHQYLLEISDIEGDVTISFNGRIANEETLLDTEESSDSVLREVYLY